MDNLEKINLITEQEIEKLNRLILSVNSGDETPRQICRTLLERAKMLKQINELSSK